MLDCEFDDFTHRVQCVGQNRWAFSTRLGAKTMQPSEDEAAAWVDFQNFAVVCNAAIGYYELP